MQTYWYPPDAVEHAVYFAQALGRKGLDVAVQAAPHGGVLVSFSAP